MRFVMVYNGSSFLISPIAIGNKLKNQNKFMGFIRFIIPRWVKMQFVLFPISLEADKPISQKKGDSFESPFFYLKLTSVKLPSVIR
jgi:hypothetical protein